MALSVLGYHKAVQNYAQVFPHHLFTRKFSVPFTREEIQCMQRVIKFALKLCVLLKPWHVQRGYLHFTCQAWILLQYKAVFGFAVLCEHFMQSMKPPVHFFPAKHKRIFNKTFSIDTYYIIILFQKFCHQQFVSCQQVLGKNRERLSERASSFDCPLILKGISALLTRRHLQHNFYRQHSIHYMFSKTLGRTQLM